jgi:hypothetical protein
MKDFYLSDRPNVVRDYQIMDKVRENKFNLGVQGHISKWEMTNFNYDVTDRIKQTMTHTIAEQIKDKLKWKTFENPALDAVTYQAEVIVMTKDELEKLLSDLGLYIVKTPQGKYND